MSGQDLYILGITLIVLGITAVVPGNILLYFSYQNKKGGKKK